MRQHDHEFMAEALAEARLWATPLQSTLARPAEMLALMDAKRSGRVANRSERKRATLYTTLEPCALCMAAAMSFLLGRIVFAARAPLDGGTNLPDLWTPPNGHPGDGIPSTISTVTGGVESDRSLRLISEWTSRPGQHRPTARRDLLEVVVRVGE